MKRLLLNSRPALRVRPLLLALTLGIASCSPAEVNGGRFVVLDTNSESQRYNLEERSIPTLRDVASMDSSLVEVRAGGDLVATTDEPQTESEWRKALLVESSETPAVDYEVQSDLVVPLDFHTTILFTLAHHIEQASRYFESIGLAETESVGRIPLYYRPSLETGLLPVPVPIFTDNAAYAFTLDAFIIPPRLMLNDLPLAANRGVIVHEYSHAVFNRVVHQNRRAPAYLTENWEQLAVNEMLSLDEGIADIFGALQTADSNFIEPSLSDGIALDRDLAEFRVYDAALLENAGTRDELEYNPYPLGSVLASAIWTLRDAISDDDLGRAVLGALRVISGPDGTFRITDFVNAFLMVVAADQRSQACEVFLERFVAVADDIACEVVL